MQFTVRAAEPTDISTLLQFEQGVIAAERPFDSTIRSGAIRYYDLGEMIAAPHIQLLVAEKEEQLIGSGYARIEASKPYLQHKQHAYLGFMYVLPQHRGMGVNKAILQALEAWSAVQGAHELRLDVYAANEPAVRAYEKAGFTALMMEMRKKV